MNDWEDLKPSGKSYYPAKGKKVMKTPGWFLSPACFRYQKFTTTDTEFGPCRAMRLTPNKWLVATKRRGGGWFEYTVVGPVVTKTLEPDE
jgi:hypothetical protein